MLLSFTRTGVDHSPVEMRCRVSMWPLTGTSRVRPSLDQSVGGACEWLCSHDKTWRCGRTEMGGRGWRKHHERLGVVMEKRRAQTKENEEQNSLLAGGRNRQFRKRRVDC